MIEEQYKEKIIHAEEATAISEIVNTTAWRKIIIPRIDQMKAEAMKVIYNSNVTNEIFNAREKLKALDDIILTLGYKQKRGEEAKKELSNISV